ncbi:MAG: type I restriction endonuclease [Halobacteriota archaeon]
MKEQARQKLQELIERFRYNLDVYKKSAYNETQVRREFIDPFFEALGWDVSNKQGYGEQYKEVVHEDAIKVGRSTRAPDYSFRIGGQRKFFVEAKKPAVKIKEDVSPSYQLRRYAWSAKLPLSVVTDFEELSVFDCQIKPNSNDKPGVGRIAYYTFEEYLDKFDAIYDVFSKEAVLKGSFDMYAQSTKGKKGTAEVDSEFLKEIESWRELLAKNIALRNPAVSIYELNYAVQKIIDRIIFLRICEDRGIEPYGQLQTQAEGGDVYMHLKNHFKLAQSKYDSGIFDFDTDRITPALSIDDRVLKTIIQSLYYPKSPYEFSVLGVEILGNVYEQFLGKVIRLTAGHQAKVETKPEVKKAGGVYYTPQYIVDYIVKNTVGKLIAGKTPEEIADIKILDPACGSGSFLIGAYTYLLRYHLDWYVNNKPKRHKETVFQVRENEWP